MDVESKIENLFEDHSIINILKNVKAPTPITEDNLTSLTISRRSGIQSINTSMISMRLLMVLAFTWQSLADLTLLSLSEKTSRWLLFIVSPLADSGLQVALLPSGVQRSESLHQHY